MQVQLLSKKALQGLLLRQGRGWGMYSLSTVLLTRHVDLGTQRKDKRGDGGEVLQQQPQCRDEHSLAARQAYVGSNSAG